MSPFETQEREYFEKVSHLKGIGWYLNRSRHDSTEDIQRQIHQIAQKVFADVPEPIGEELDLQRLFVRILDKEDWTDKLASGLGKIRSKLTQPRRDTKSSKKLRTVNNRPHIEAKLPEESRTKNRRHHWDINLPKELQSLVPDMREVEKAYVQMTNGYKDFIRDVMKANRLRQGKRDDTSSIEDSEHS